MLSQSLAALPLLTALRCVPPALQVNPITGRGPAWANSLFEDNAQFGLGIHMGLKQRRASYANAVKSLLADPSGPGSTALRNAFEEWLQVRTMLCAYREGGLLLQKVFRRTRTRPGCRICS